MINTDIYGSLDEASAYFAGRLHSEAWNDAETPTSRKPCWRPGG